MIMHVRGLLLLCLCWPLAAAYALDISGVALGSDLARAEAILARANPALKFKAIHSKDGSRIGLVGREVATGISAFDGKVEEFLRDEYLVVAEKTGTVRYVERNVKTTRDRLMSHLQVVQALRRQYGGPSSQSSPSGRPEVLINNIVWENDTRRRRYVGPVESGPCGMPTLERQEFSDGVIEMPKGVKDGCGTLVVAKVPRPTVDGILMVLPKPLGISIEGKIASYSVFILDGAAFTKR